MRSFSALPSSPPTQPTITQVITEYKDSELDLVLEATERMHEHLTAAVVSNDILFTQASAVFCTIQCVPAKEQGRSKPV